MCLSPKTSRSSINSFFNMKSTNRNSSKEDTDNKLSKKRLSSRNNEIIKNPKKYLYKKIIPNNLIQFSSNNSTSSNTSHLNNVKANNPIFNEYDNKCKNPNYIKRNMKYFKRQDYSNILINNTKEKIENIFQKYKKKTYNRSNINNSNYNYNSNSNNNNYKARHNRSLSKNLNQDLVISKLVDKLVIDNINKINKLNLNLNPKSTKFDKLDIEKTFLGSMTTKEYHPYLKTNSKNNINFPISTNYKNIISINNINSLGISRHSALTSSTGNIYTKKNSRQIHSSRQNRPNSNDNIKKNKNNKNNCTNGNSNKGKVLNLSKYSTKGINNNITFNNYCQKQKKYSNGVGLNNNKIEYVQINLFNNGHEDKIVKEKNYMCNRIEKKISNGGNNNSNMKNLKNKEKEVKLFDSDINGSNDGLYMTKSFLSINDKSRLTKDLNTPEESHFQAVNYAQLIKNNNKKFS